MTFFDERADESEVKARIIEKYFSTWANIIMPTAAKFGNRIGYIDLYAGPGRYRNGAASTPLLVLEKAAADQKLSQMLVATFNDADKDHSDTLAKEIAKVPRIGNLRHTPKVYNTPIDETTADGFAKINLMPSFTFLDPFGYKGLSLKIVNAVIQSWGCDCVFFFNYRRINAGITNKFVEEHMNALFSDERADELRKQIVGRTPIQRELLILENMALALKDMKAKFVLPFRFKNESRTTHYLIFVTKEFKGYEVMKEIMAKESSTSEEGVASFAYSPADATTPFLFSFNQPLAKLKGQICKQFAGKTVKMWDVYREHSVDTPYIKRNYKELLLKMELAKEIKANPPAAKRPKRGGVPTFADTVEVTFP